MTETATAAAPRRSGGAHLAAAAFVVAAALAWLLFAVPEEEATLWRTYRPSGFLPALAVSLVAAATLHVIYGRGDAKTRFFRTILAAFATGFCFVLAEVPAVLGHDYQVTFGTRPGDAWLQIAGGINRFDPELIHIHRPHDTFDGHVAGNLAYLGLPGGRPYRVSVRYDRNGFRNDTDIDAAEVVTVGDSFVEAAIIPRAAIASERLGERLGTKVANLGQEGYGLRQELAVLRRFALPLKPRFVVWFLFGGNDLRDVEDYESMVTAMSGERPRAPLRDRMFIANALLALSRITTPDRTEPSALALSHSALFTRDDGVRERIYFSEGEEFYDAPSWQVATETLAEADRLCREAGATLLVAYIPRKYRVYRAHVEIAPGSAAAGWTPSDLPARFAGWTATQKIAFLDLSSALEREVAARHGPYLLDDVHWNARGHDVAADEIALELRRLGWTPPEKRQR